MLHTKIICTIGPASESPEMLASLMLAGMDVARLNLSHGAKDYHAENIRRIRAVAAEIHKPVAILFDLQGPKLRVGKIGGNGVELASGQSVFLTIREEPATHERIPVQFKRLPQAVRPGHRILLDDGMLELIVEAVDDEDVACRVITGGLLTSNKGINLPQVDLSIPAITDKDKEDLAFALDQRADWIALSFVRQAEEMRSLKEMIQEHSPFGRSTPVIAKIEKPEALANIGDIIAASDGIMVARGDLGIETSPEEVPMMQKEIIARCNRAGVPVITATQMLDSMIRNPRPTRAEASDVANAILDGTDAIMLSGETAVGKYPVRAVQTMVRIAEQVERSLKPLQSRPSITEGCTITDAVCYAAVDTVDILGASAIIAPTVGGTTARTLSRYRPPRPIIAATPSPTVLQQLVLYWGVRPVPSRRAVDTDGVIMESVRAAQEAGLIQEAETVVVTAGAAGSAPGLTDLIKVHTLARTLAHGHGVGTHQVAGQIRRLEGPLGDDVNIQRSDIIATTRTDRTFIPILRRAAGLISLQGGMDSHCALMAIELGLPAVVGIDTDIETFKEGQWVVLNPEEGVVTERLGMRSPEVY